MPIPPEWVQPIIYLGITTAGWVGTGGTLLWRMGKRDQRLADTIALTERHQGAINALESSVRDIKSRTIDNGLVDDIKDIKERVVRLEVVMETGFGRVHDRIDSIRDK